MTQTAVDGAAPEVQTEFDRLWQALDSLNTHVQDIDQRMVCVSRAQAAPSPDYRMGEPFGDVTLPGVAPAEGPCSCEEAIELRAQLRGVLDQAGISADVDEGRDPLDAARSLRRDLNAAQDEGVALRAEVERLRAEIERVPDFTTLARLAAANALLAEYVGGPYPDTKAKARAYLAAQP